MFEKLKASLMANIEKNSYKTKLTYKDREGVEHEEEVYLKRGLGIFGDWHQINLPVKTDGTNKWDIMNAWFGGKKNLIKLILYLAIFIFFMFAVRNLPCVQSCLQLINYG